MAEEVHSIKLERKVLRGAFTRICSEIDSVQDIESEEGANIISEKLNALEGKASRLFDLDVKMREALLAKKISDEEYEKEFEAVEAYREKYDVFRSKCNQFRKLLSIEANSSISVPVPNVPPEKEKRNFRLPQIELKIFNGDVRNWIGFWGQFKKIHEDETIDKEDKYQYLLQATEKGSSARTLVESFPPSAANYDKAVSCLKNRYARDDYLIEVYVRDLLGLVFNRDSKSKIPLCNLYDNLVTRLRSLESLGLGSEKYAAILLPLVESTLCDDMLRGWERHRNSIKTTQSSAPAVLEELLGFLRNEVESEQRILLARGNVCRARGDVSGVRGDSSREKEVKESIKPATASAILCTDTGEKCTLCLFCKRGSHAPQECHKACDMSLEDKNKILNKERRCFSCLKTGHMSKRCKTFVKCFICDKRHFTAMCPDLCEIRKMKNRSKQSASDQKNLLTGSGQTYLQTILVKIRGQKRTKIIRALFDSGSQNSYITKKCVNDLKLKCLGTEEINHDLFGGVTLSPVVHKLYEVNLKAVGGNFTCDLMVLDQEKICNYVPRLRSVDEFPLLKEKRIALSDVGENAQQIDLLLGADALSMLLTGNMEQLENNFLALETKLGWTIMGMHQKQKSNILCCFNNQSITDLWTLDTLGIRDPIETKTKNMLAEAAQKHFNKTVVVNKEGRYEISLPWIEGHFSLQQNRKVAEKRLETATKILTNKGIYNQYDKVFQEWQQEGIIEEIEEGDEEELGFYLPHRAVFKESSKTTKIRPVFDASCKDMYGHSLNDCLEKGPNLVENIPSLLMNFRLRNIGVTADIRKAFLQISINEKDRKYLKFLWWRNYEERSLKLYQHCRVVFGIAPGPFLLGASIQYHLERMPIHLEATANKLKDSFYLDNCVTSVDDEEDFKIFKKEATEIMSAGKFELREWYSNIYNKEIKDFKHCEVVSVLGLLWNIANDTILCDVPNFNKINIPVTKRGLLSAAQRIFDPIGFTSPISLTAKLLLQDTWKIKLAWDTELPADLGNRFRRWQRDVMFLEDCVIPRKITTIPASSSNASLHVFCDASKTAYAACVFLRVQNAEEVSIQLVCAKSRISPMKPATIPRLELLAAVIGVRLCQTVQTSLKFKIQTVYWTDSTVVLTWIQKDDAWNIFVGNRVREILSHSNKEDWRHVPGFLNPADLLSRGCTARHLVRNKWWNGPEWLQGEPDSWPDTKIEWCQEADEEKRKSVISSLNCNKVSLNFNHFGKYIKNIRTMSWILRFYRNIKYPKTKTKGELKNDEIREGEIRIFKLIQAENFENTSKYSFKIFKDDNDLLRVETKLAFTNEKYNFKFPILLPCNNPLVEKLVYDVHVKNMHAGVQTTVSLLRENYWILKARKFVRQIIFKCTVCKRFRAKAAVTPATSLPSDRVASSYAFETSGIDLAGPLFLKNKSKVWIVLFTCAVYRAIHLEIVSSLSTESFLLALRRFISRRGKVRTIYSDNGTNFKGTFNELKTLNWDRIESDTITNNITWKFIPPTAAWWGGWWERLIRVVKELLRRNLQRASLGFEELSTVICYCESIVNARPLTYVSDDVEDLIPITPSMFLQDITNINVEEFDAIDSRSLNRRRKHLLNLRENLKNRFRKEYLAKLVSVKNDVLNSLKTGDIVLIENENKKRIYWPLAKITEMYPGKDGIPRVARLRTCSGEITRPIQRLYPLEVSSNQNLLEAEEKKAEAEEKKAEAEEKEKTEVCNKSNKKRLRDEDEEKQQSTRSGRILR